jgi:hypothetical protein
MTVAELIKQLEATEQNAEVEIVIHQHNKIYPIAYVPVAPTSYPVVNGPHKGANNETLYVRINVALPDNIKTREIKEVKAF